MKRTSFAVIAASTIGLIATTALADEAQISAPSANQVINENTLELFGMDPAATGVQWAVRLGTCDANTGTVAGNVDGYATPFNFDEGNFSSTLDITSWYAGQYCFVLNTGVNRLTQWFYIVDGYAKISGTIFFSPVSDVRPSALAGELLTLGGRSPSHTFKGLVGNAGAAGTVGSIEVNYRELGVTCEFIPSSLSFDDDAPGIVGTGMDLRAVLPSTSTCAAENFQFYILDRAVNDYSDAIGPRGAVVVRQGNTGAPVQDLDIDNTLGTGGGASWVSLARGNALVGTR